MRTIADFGIDSQALYKDVGNAFPSPMENTSGVGDKTKENVEQ